MFHYQLKGFTNPLTSQNLSTVNMYSLFESNVKSLNSYLLPTTLNICFKTKIIVGQNSLLIIRQFKIDETFSL